MGLDCTICLRKARNVFAWGVLAFRRHTTHRRVQKILDTRNRNENGIFVRRFVHPKGKTFRLIFCFFSGTGFAHQTPKKWKFGARLPFFLLLQKERKSLGAWNKLKQLSLLRFHLEASEFPLGRWRQTWKWNTTAWEKNAGAIKRCCCSTTLFYVRSLHYSSLLNSQCPVATARGEINVRKRGTP